MYKVEKMDGTVNQTQHIQRVNPHVQRVALAAERRAARSDAELDAARDAAMRAYEAHGAYFPGYSSYNLKKEREYIDRLEKENARLEKENARLEKENARLEKENAALIELLPGRGGSRKRKAMNRITRRKRQ
jgi:hypothetical protein